jgi:hypothetical protein
VRVRRGRPESARRIADLDGSGELAPSALGDADEVVSGWPPDDRSAGLVLAGHALAHADNLDDLVSRLEGALAPGGLMTAEFHHVVSLAEGQFDVLSHAHRSYLSLASLEPLFARHGLVALAAERTATYGGTVRMLVGRALEATSPAAAPSGIDTIRDSERVARVGQADGFAGLAEEIARVSSDLRRFLDDARAAGRTVAAYGAAARGTTLLNVAGVGVERLPFVADRAPAKQHRLLPRARIPVMPPSEIERARPDDILILPWPSAPDIIRQLAFARDWGARFATAMPRLEVIA